MKTSNYLTFDVARSGSNYASEISTLEETHRMWTRGLQPMDSVADQIRKLIEADSLAVKMTNQYQDMDRQRMESIQKMLAPVADIHRSFAQNSGALRVLEEVARSNLISDMQAKMANEASRIGCAAKAIQDSMQLSLTHAHQAIAASSITSTFSNVLKSYQDVQERWIVPAELVSSVGALMAMQEQFGKLTLPVMDWAAAATLAKVLGPEGMEAQLAALGIGPDGSLFEEALPATEADLGFSRRALDLMTLLSFILAVLVPIYQELSSRESQLQTEKKLEAQSLLLEAQAKRFEALSRLVEKALMAEARRTEARFVVLERVAVIRRQPEHGAIVLGKLLPHEVVRPVSEQGQWIQFEYYHWLMQEYQTGWALKKYFKRVPATYDRERH